MPTRTMTRWVDCDTWLQQLRFVNEQNFRDTSTLVVFLVAVFAAAVAVAAASSLASGSFTAFSLPFVLGATVMAVVLAFLAADVLIHDRRIMA